MTVVRLPRVSPSTVAAGGQVTLNVDGCDGETKVTSGVFEDTAIHKGQKSATAHGVLGRQAGRDVRGDVHLQRQQSRQRQDRPHHRHRPPRPQQPPPRPARPPRSTTPTRASRPAPAAASAGFDLHEIALGGALIAGTFGTAYYKMRRRTGGDHS